MTTFDGSTHATERGDSVWPEDVKTAMPPEQSRDPFDALDMLREQIEEREESSERTTHVTVPKLGWRLVCGIDFEYKRYKDWQKAALPRNQRNGRKMNPLDMDQAVLGQLILLNTCESLEYQTSSGEWVPLLDPKDRPILLDNSDLMTRFGVVDPRTLVRKLFGGDAATILAGQKVARDAGFAEDDTDGDETDPLG